MSRPTVSGSEFRYGMLFCDKPTGPPTQAWRAGGLCAAGLREYVGVFSTGTGRLTSGTFWPEGGEWYVLTQAELDVLIAAKEDVLIAAKEMETPF